MSVEVFLGFVVDIDLELGDFVLGLGDYNEVVCGKNFELFSLILVFFALPGWIKIGSPEVQWLSLHP